MSNIIKGKIELESGSVMAFDLYPAVCGKLRQAGRERLL